MRTNGHRQDMSLSICCAFVHTRHVFLQDPMISFELSEAGSLERWLPLSWVWQLPKMKAPWVWGLPQITEFGEVTLALLNSRQLVTNQSRNCYHLVATKRVDVCLWKMPHRRCLCLCRTFFWKSLEGSATFAVSELARTGYLCCFIWGLPTSFAASFQRRLCYGAVFLEVQPDRKFLAGHCKGRLSTANVVRRKLCSDCGHGSHGSGRAISSHWDLGGSSEVACLTGRRGAAQLGRLHQCFSFSPLSQAEARRLWHLARSAPKTVAPRGAQASHCFAWPRWA